MSTKHIRTTADLSRFRAALRIECQDCAATRTMSSMEAMTAFGFVQIEAARKRLKCSRCGSKAARLAILPPV
jgi:hypothetical protein